MAKIDPSAVDKIIEYVGGRDNITAVTHCITRLRFILNDDAKADAEKLKSLPMVKASFATGGHIKWSLVKKWGTITKFYLKRQA
ncbi:PTS system trehalose-specific transporter subunit IIBC [Pasteurella canis]|nr:PTS system trehalose-specific transporter subunit IIBC [Pasteurella canis]